MEQPFLILYDFFHKRRKAFWLCFLTLIALLAFGAMRIHLEEDITRFFPNDKRVEKLSFIFQNSKLAEKLVVMISVKDSSTAPRPDSLVAYADSLLVSIKDSLAPHLSSIRGKVDDSQMLTIFSSLQDHLPIYLTDNDYSYIDSVSYPANAKAILLDNYKQLISPGGMVMKNVIIKDPLGFSFPC